MPEYWFSTDTSTESYAAIPPTQHYAHGSTRADGPSDYKLCKGEHTDCTTINFKPGDQTKGQHCRTACSQKIGELSEKITAYYCETPEEPCTLYDVYGRPGYDKNFERHVLCVQACQFVAKVEQSTETSFKLCRGVEERCSPIEKKDGSFDGFRKCIFKCDGWVNLENTKENTAYLCPLSGDCQKGNYFTKKNEKGAFASLKACFETCISE
ncbi:hypothetical protein SprV_0200956000 [Sparganum proliferum]